MFSSFHVCPEENAESLASTCLEGRLSEVTAEPCARDVGGPRQRAVIAARLVLHGSHGAQPSIRAAAAFCASDKRIHTPLDLTGAETRPVLRGRTHALSFQGNSLEKMYTIRRGRVARPGFLDSLSLASNKTVLCHRLVQTGLLTRERRTEGGTDRSVNRPKEGTGSGAGSVACLRPHVTLCGVDWQKNKSPA